MNNEQHAWARAELERRYPDPDNAARKAVTALLSVWTRVDVPLTDPALRDDAVSVFASLARLEPLEDTAGDLDPTRVWAPASRYATMGVQHARILRESVPAADAWMYAGRVGSIVALRRGLLTIEFLVPLDGAPNDITAPVKSFEVDIAHITQS